VFSIFGVEKDSRIVKMEIEDSTETLAKIFEPIRLCLARDKHIHNTRPNPYSSSENF